MRFPVVALLGALGAAIGAGPVGAGGCTMRDGASARDASGCVGADVEIARTTQMIFFRTESEPVCRDGDLSAVYYGRRLNCNISVAQFAAIGCGGPGAVLETGPDGLVAVALCRVDSDAVAAFLARRAAPR